MPTKRKPGRPRLPENRKLGVMLSFNVSDALVAKIERLAKLRKCSRAKAAREVLAEGLKDVRRPRGPKPMALKTVVVRGLTIPAATMRKVVKHARRLPGARGKSKPPRMAALRDLIERGLANAGK